MQRDCHLVTVPNAIERPSKVSQSGAAYDSRRPSSPQPHEDELDYVRRCAVKITDTSCLFHQLPYQAMPQTIDPAQLFSKTSVIADVKQPLSVSSKQSCLPRLTHTSEAAFRYPSPISDSSAANTPEADSEPSQQRKHWSASTSHGLRPVPESSHSLTLPKMTKEVAHSFTYVDSLVEVATLVVDSLWPSSSNNSFDSTNKVLSYFITETSRKSKTSLSTMQLTLMYCMKLKQQQIGRLTALRQLYGQIEPSVALIRATVGSGCARRNFLSALILASKYLQDRNFSNKAWSKISAVPIADINSREREFLDIIQWRLDIKQDFFKVWAETLERIITEVQENTMFGFVRSCKQRWRTTLLNISNMPTFDKFSLAAELLSHDVQDDVLQLLTPLASPAEVVSAFDFSVRPVEECLTTPACLLFDEFVQSSPRILATELEAANYATPESSGASPMSSETSSAFSVSSVELHDIAYKQNQPLASYQPSEYSTGLKRGSDDGLQCTAMKRSKKS